MDNEETDDHVVPARPSIEVLQEYTLDQDRHAAADIQSYVEGQAPDEIVLHVEFVKEEFAVRDKYEVWDVTTDKSRWWVLTNLTNLYSQEHFPSMDYLLSFHIGLMARLSERSRSEPNWQEVQFGEIERRQAAIHAAYDRAVEASDFQEIGLQIRETMISLMQSLSEFVALPTGTEMPRRGDFKALSTALASALLSGRPNQAIRKYVRTTAHEAWDLANWLTHARSAEGMATLVAMQGLDKTVGDYLFSLKKHEGGEPACCPDCNSRRLRSHYDINIGDEGAYFVSCGSCSWDGHPDGSA